MEKKVLTDKNALKAKKAITVKKKMITIITDNG